MEIVRNQALKLLYFPTKKQSFETNGCAKKKKKSVVKSFASFSVAGLKSDNFQTTLEALYGERKALWNKIDRTVLQNKI